LIGNATVVVCNSSLSQSYAEWKLVKEVKTDADGRYSVEVRNDPQLRVYAYRINPNSMSIDYVPSFIDIDLKTDNIINLRLLPAASLIFDNKVWSVDSTMPVKINSFIVVDNDNPNLYNVSHIDTYGTSNYPFLDLQPNQVIVPLDRNIIINVRTEAILGSPFTVPS